FAGEVYLQEGLNTVTAMATDGAGLDVSASISVTFVPEVSPLSLTVIPQSGIQPLEVTLEAEAFITNPVANYQWDTDGNGTIDTSGAMLFTITNTYTNPGMYLPRVIVTDTLNNRYEATAVVTVLSFTEMDALLRARWEEMRVALSNGDIEGSLVYFLDASQARYREQFTALAPVLPEIAADMSNISHLLWLEENHAEFELLRIEGGEEFSYVLVFMRDGQGLWKIQGF
ncbi:MAG: PKD domain-containing protein, partial [Nitrospirae bacterium]|nr:PKD domain-containing protein [Nitrospirota bacterium]